MQRCTRHRLGFYATGAALLATACAAPVQVTEVASGSGPAVFEFQGDSLVGLQAVAAKACPSGYADLRHWQGGQTTAPQASLGDRAWFQAQRLVGETSSRAQLVVQCLTAGASMPMTATGTENAVDAGAPKTP